MIKKIDILNSLNILIKTINKMSYNNFTHKSYPRFTGVYGIDNLGNTCYLNSIIQTLSNITHFRNFLLDKNFDDYLIVKLNQQNLTFKEKLKLLADSPIYQLYRFIDTIWSVDNKIKSSSLKPGTFRSKLSKKNDIFRSSDQQDAHEAFGILIEMIHTEIAQNVKFNPLIDNQLLINACDNFWSKEYSPIYNMFHGMYLISRKCNECNCISESYQPNLFLELDIPKSPKKVEFKIEDYIKIKCKIPKINISERTKTLMCNSIDKTTFDKIKEEHEIITSYNSNYDLTECIEDFISEKKIDDAYCGFCETTCFSSTKTQLAIPPKILCIQIKRFLNNITKSLNLVNFPEKLNIDNILTTPNQFKTNYKLVSVINHSGKSLGFGHYYTYTNSSIYDMWFNYNDEHVQPISNDELCTPDAYLLFYELE